MKPQKTLSGLFFSAFILLGAGTARASGESGGDSLGWKLPDNPGLPDDFMGSVNNIADWLLGFVILITVLALVYGGIVYVASVGDEDRTRSAKKIIKYAIIGLVMAALAWAIPTVVIKDVLKGSDGGNGTQGAAQSGAQQATQGQGVPMY